MAGVAYSLDEIHEITGFSTNAIGRAIRDDWENMRDQDVKTLPKLRAKRGSGKKYIVLANDLVR